MEGPNLFLVLEGVGKNVSDSENKEDNTVDDGKFLFV